MKTMRMRRYSDEFTKAQLGEMPLRRRAAIALQNIRSDWAEHMRQYTDDNPDPRLTQALEQVLNVLQPVLLPLKNDHIEDNRYITQTYIATGDVDHLESLAYIDDAFFADIKIAVTTIKKTERDIVAKIIPSLKASAEDLLAGKVKINMHQIPDEMKEQVPVQVLRATGVGHVQTLVMALKLIADDIKSKSISKVLNRDIEIIQELLTLNIQVATQQPLPERSGPPKLTFVKS